MIILTPSFTVLLIYNSTIQLFFFYQTYKSSGNHSSTFLNEAPQQSPVELEKATAAHFKVWLIRAKWVCIFNWWQFGAVDAW